MIQYDEEEFLEPLYVVPTPNHGGGISRGDIINDMITCSCFGTIFNRRTAAPRPLGEGNRIASEDFSDCPTLPGKDGTR